MRVVCQRIVSPTTGEKLRSSPWLTVGHEYLVLEVVADPAGEVRFRLLGDDETGGPGVWDARLFTIASGRVPAVWTATLDDRGVLTLGPTGWQREGFWEDYFDRDSAAVADFEEAKRALLDEEARRG